MSIPPINIDRNGFFLCSASIGGSRRKSKRNSQNKNTRRISTSLGSAAAVDISVDVSVPTPVTPEHEHDCRSQQQRQRQQLLQTPIRTTPGTDIHGTLSCCSSNDSRNNGSIYSSDDKDNVSISWQQKQYYRHRHQYRQQRQRQRQHQSQHQREHAKTGIVHGTNSTSAPTSITPTSSSTLNSCWVGVQAMLKSEPCLATQKGLFLALKHHAPIQVLKFLLTINPNIVDIAKTGPTPLQVALYHDSSLEAIALLLEASPFGLCITNSDCPEDPLSYANRKYGAVHYHGSGDGDDDDDDGGNDNHHHRYRPGLIELLSRPLSYWVSGSRGKSQIQETKNHGQDHCRQQHQEQQRKEGGTHPNYYRIQSLARTKPSSSLSPQPLLLPPPPLYTLRGFRTTSTSNDESSLSSAATTTAGSSTRSRNYTHKQPSPPLPKNNASTDDTAANAPLLQNNRGANNKSLKQQQRVQWKSPNGNNSSSNSRNQSSTTTIDREEINNVKKICAQLCKAHRRMSQQMIAVRGNIDAQSELLATMGTKEEILEELLKQQRSQFFRNMIALDMKEKAYQGRLDQMEQRYVVQLETRLDRCRSSTRLWNETTRERLLDLQSIVEAEAKINTVFRNDMNTVDSVERYQDENESQENDGSYVFATNSGEEDEKVSLCCCCGGGGGGALRSGDRTFHPSDPNGTMARYALVDTDSDNSKNNNSNKMNITTTDPIIGKE